MASGAVYVQQDSVLGDTKVLTGRKDTLESTEGFCKPVTDQEGGNGFSNLVWSILMHCMATLWQDLHLELALHLSNCEVFIQPVHTC